MSLERSCKVYENLGLRLTFKMNFFLKNETNLVNFWKLPELSYDVYIHELLRCYVIYENYVLMCLSKNALFR